MTTAASNDAIGRRLERLRHELLDDGIWLPADDALRRLLLAEVDYARHPHAHEGNSPRYGALITTPGPVHDHALERLELVDIGDVPLRVARRLADGRSSFVVRVVDGRDRLVCFERTREYESSSVHLTLATGALVVQRLGEGWVRLSTGEGVAVWDGIHWSKRPLASSLVGRVAPHVPGANQVVLTNLLELCSHWLAAGRVGATLVWRLDGDPRELAHLGLQAAVEIPPLELSRRAHFAALLNALSQYDRAALVDPSGRIVVVGAHLVSSEAARRELAPFRGTRHTSALRFSSDEHGTITFVVSSNGSLSVFHRGVRLDTD